MERKAAEAQRQASGSTKKKKKKKNPEDVRIFYERLNDFLISKFQAGERSDTDEEDLNPVQKLKRKIGEFIKCISINNS